MKLIFKIRVIRFNYRFKLENCYNTMIKVSSELWKTRRRRSEMKHVQVHFVQLPEYANKMFHKLRHSAVCRPVSSAHIIRDAIHLILSVDLPFI